MGVEGLVLKLKIVEFWFFGVIQGNINTNTKEDFFLKISKDIYFGLFPKKDETKT